MTSSNRHWPSLFKSKPYTAQQWQGDVNTSLSTAFAKPPYTPATGGEERAPEPKPRWNPKPEQIRILEGIFNSGMVNPPRDEIRRIRMQLQEYGQVGDANIFYWFQNRKSRSKHKQRLQQQSSKQHRSAVPPVSTAACSSSSSSSDPSTPSLAEPPKKAPPELSPTVERAAPAQKAPLHGAPEAAALYVSPAGFWSELVCQHEAAACRGGTGSGTDNAEDEEGKAKLLLHSLYGTLPSASAAAAPDTIPSTATAANLFSPILPNYMATVSNPIVTSDDVLQGGSVGFGEFGGGGVTSAAARPTVVFINEVAFEVGASPVNIREAFGHEALLFSSSGLPVLVDEWGVTLQPLQPGASYYLV